LNGVHEISFPCILSSYLRLSAKSVDDLSCLHRAKLALRQIDQTCSFGVIDKSTLSLSVPGSG
jgi:hypothetical protein